MGIDVEEHDLRTDIKSWTDFDTIETAQKRLLSASRLQIGRAHNVQQVTDAFDDLGYTSLLGGAIGGATGSVDAAGIGAGLAALLAIPPDRYRAAAQRQNLKNVGAAYQCLADTITGLTTTALETPVLPVSTLTEERRSEINTLRYELVDKVGRAAADIERGYRVALENIAITQPDLQKFEQSVGRQNQRQPEINESVKLLQSGGEAGVRAASLTDPETIDQKQRKIELARAELLVITLKLQALGPKSGTNKQEFDTLTNEQTRLNASITTLEGEISAKLRSVMTDRGLYVQRLLIQRLGVFEEASAKCKAMVAAQ